MNVMKKAWEIAKGAARINEGTAKEYFAESLKIAWEMKKSFKVSNVSSRHWANYGKERQYISFTVAYQDVKNSPQGVIVSEYKKNIEFHYDFQTKTISEKSNVKVTTSDATYSQFVLTNIEDAKQKEIDKIISNHATTRNRFDELAAAAERMNDEDFEDIYDLPRELVAAF